MVNDNVGSDVEGRKHEVPKWGDEGTWSYGTVALVTGDGEREKITKMAWVGVSVDWQDKFKSETRVPNRKSRSYSYIPWGSSLLGADQSPTPLAPLLSSPDTLLFLWFSFCYPFTAKRYIQCTASTGSRTSILQPYLLIFIALIMTIFEFYTRTWVCMYGTFLWAMRAWCADHWNKRAYKKWKRFNELTQRYREKIKFLLKCRQEGLIPNHLSRARINYIHLTNQSNRTKLENVLNMSFIKILDIEIDDLNFRLRIVKNELQKSVLIIESTPENIYTKSFQIEECESSILAEKLYRTHEKKS